MFPLFSFLNLLMMSRWFVQSSKSADLTQVRSLQNVLLSFLTLNLQIPHNQLMFNDRFGQLDLVTGIFLNYWQQFSHFLLISH
jgi:hypothetical protein